MASLGLLLAGFSIVMPLTLFGLLVVLVVGVSTSRNEPDPHNHRLPATYLTAVSFVLVFTLLFAATAAVASLTSLVGEDDETSFSEEPDFGDSFGNGITRVPPPTPVSDSDVEDATAGVIAALLVAGAAGGMLWHYRRTLIDLIESDGFRGHAGTRVVHTYLYAIQFVAVLILVGAAAASLYGLVQVLVPDVLSENDPDSVREGGVRLFLTAGALAAGAAGLAVAHMREHARLEPRPASPPVL